MHVLLVIMLMLMCLNDYMQVVACLWAFSITFQMCTPVDFICR